MTDSAPRPRRTPKPTPETQHFWDGTREGELRLQRCDVCEGSYFPPRPFCPACGSREVSIVVASGRALLHAFVINQRPGPGFEEPHSIAVVELEEGPRMMTNIVECEQTLDALTIDMPVEVIFEKQDDEITLPLFRPVGASAGNDGGAP